jgi:hypothetical protein
MRYRIQDIEDQIIATLQADTANMTGVQIKSHAGEVNARTFLDPSMLEGFVTQLPFVFIQYQGKRATLSDTVRGMYVHELRFRLYVGAQSLRVQQEAQRSCYAILGAVYDDLHGKKPNSAASQLSVLPALSGNPITTDGFNPQTPLMEAGGEDEKLIVNLPQIKVYYTDYVIRVVA